MLNVFLSVRTKEFLGVCFKEKLNAFFNRRVHKHYMFKSIFNSNINHRKYLSPATYP